jgi:DNA-binding MarR family transcriptional regulator
VVQAVAHTVDTVFLIAVPLAAVAFALTWLLPEVPLRRSIRSTEPGQGLSPAEGRSSLATIELALERMAARENRAEVYANLAQRAGLDLSPASSWLLFRLEDGPAPLGRIAQRAKVDPGRLEAGVAALVTKGFLVQRQTDGGEELELTTTGRAAVEKLAGARRAGMTELLEGWDPEAHPEVVDMVRRLARAFVADDEKLLADVRSAAVGAA